MLQYGVVRFVAAAPISSGCLLMLVIRECLSRQNAISAKRQAGAGAKPSKWPVAIGEFRGVLFRARAGLGTVHCFDLLVLRGFDGG
jgi:hypothetical protein